MLAKYSVMNYGWLIVTFGSRCDRIKAVGRNLKKPNEDKGSQPRVKRPSTWWVVIMSMYKSSTGSDWHCLTR